LTYDLHNRLFTFVVLKENIPARLVYESQCQYLNLCSIIFDFCTYVCAISMDVRNIFLFPGYSQHPYLPFATPNICISTNLSIMHFTELISRSIILYERVIVAQRVKNVFACYVTRKIITLRTPFFWNIMPGHWEIGFRRLEGIQSLFFTHYNQSPACISLLPTDTFSRFLNYKTVGSVRNADVSIRLTESVITLKILRTVADKIH
jgi:hypothetical protein